MDEKTKNLLYRSFEDDLTPEEKNLLTEALENSFELKQEKEQILRLRRNIKESKEASFKPFFAERVLNQIQISANNQNEEALFDSLFVLFRPVAIAAAVLIFFVAGYNIVNSGNISLEGALAIPEVTLDDAYNTSLAAVIEEEE